METVKPETRTNSPADFLRWFPEIGAQLFWHFNVKEIRIITVDKDGADVIFHLAPFARVADGVTLLDADAPRCPFCHRSMEYDVDFCWTCPAKAEHPDDGASVIVSLEHLEE